MATRVVQGVTSGETERDQCDGSSDHTTLVQSGDGERPRKVGRASLDH